MPVAEWSEDALTHLLSELLNDCAPLGENTYRPAAKAVLGKFDVVARHIRAETLREARADFLTEALRFKPDGWGSNPADEQTVMFGIWTLDWLGNRIDRIDEGYQTTVDTRERTL